MNEFIEKIKSCFCLLITKYRGFEDSYLKNKNENTNIKFLLRGVAGSLVLLIVIMLLPPVEYILMYLTGTDDKLELLEFIGLGMSGIIAVFGVIGLLQRAAALDAQNKLTEKGHIQERFKTATEHLGSEHTSVRIAAFNEFCHLVEIKPDWRKNIFDILCGHLRQTTRNKNYQQDTAESEKIKPTVEIHDLLDILFKPGNKDDLIFGGLKANLRGANLQGASLQEVDLIEADMYKANLQESYLEKTNLQKAYLYRADLQMANLQEANLQKARMWRAKLQKANLQKANLQKANLRWANLKNADLQGANLQGAEINKHTTMPDEWEDVVVKDENGKTGVLLMDDE